MRKLNETHTYKIKCMHARTHNTHKNTYIQLICHFYSHKCAEERAHISFNLLHFELHYSIALKLIFRIYLHINLMWCWHIKLILCVCVCAGAALHICTHDAHLFFTSFFSSSSSFIIYIYVIYVHVCVCGFQSPFPKSTIY